MIEVKLQQAELMDQSSRKLSRLSLLTK